MIATTVTATAAASSVAGDDVDITDVICHGNLGMAAPQAAVAELFVVVATTHHIDVYHLHDFAFHLLSPLTFLHYVGPRL